MPNHADGEHLHLADRRVMQDFTSLVKYLVPSVLQQLTQQERTIDSRADSLATFAAKLGLQCPSESTQSAMVAILDVAVRDLPSSASENHDRLRMLKPICTTKNWFM